MRKLRTILRYTAYTAACLLPAAVLAVLAAELGTALLAAGQCHNTPAECRAGDVGVVLGCSKGVSKGRPNPYFTARMEAAARLWHSGKLRCIIVSGDNRERYYNEPRDMKNALVRLGVPEERIVSDHAGLCTYDSVRRAQRVFGATRITYISQPFHVRRAVALGRLLGQEAQGFHAPYTPTRLRPLLRQLLRERGARVAMLYYLLLRDTPQEAPLPLPE